MDIDFSPVLDNWRFLGFGLMMTIVLSVASMAAASVVGASIGIARSYGPRPLTIPLAFYVDTMRAIPVLVVLVWTFFAQGTMPYDVQQKQLELFANEVWPAFK